MAILDKLITGDSTLTSFNGAKPPQMPASTDASALHDEYSINGVPNVTEKPDPSTLDLDGQVPSYNYKDNLPAGASF